MLRKTNFIMDICPLFNVRYFLSYIYKYINKYSVTDNILENIWSNSKSIFGQNTKKIIIDYTPIYITKKYKKVTSNIEKKLNKHILNIPKIHIKKTYRKF